MDLSDFNKVWEIKTLKKVGEEDARKMLDRIAQQVQPIMRKHKWSVKLLSEFCPNTPALLGLNIGGGVQIKLRLRRHNRDWDFLPFDEVLDTMLHELCHNVHAPHNASFYKLWDEIRVECEELIAKGITGSGQGFDLPGRRLGGFSRKNSLREAAVVAAQKRARVSAILPSGPRCIGGNRSIKIALSPVQAAAMAAERRLLDNIWCGSECCDASMKEEGGSGDHVMKSHGSSDDHVMKSHGSSESQIKDDKPDCSVPMQFHDSADPKFPSISSCSNTEHVVVADEDEPTVWECGSCTFLNQLLAPVCKIWEAQRTQHTSLKYKYWSCKFCTLENLATLDKCSACNQWRYSRGPPVATPAPYNST